MARETNICPHCRAKKSMESRCETWASSKRGFLLFICESCEKPIVLLIGPDKPDYDYRQIHDVQRADQSVKECGWRLLETWPKPEFRTDESPLGAPEAIRALFEQSQQVASKGAYDLSIMGFQRVLKMARSTASPGFQGNSRAWVLSLIASGKVTADMKSWANRVTLQSDVEGGNALQAEEMATFVHIILEQVFGVRSRIALYRAKGAQ